MRSLKSELIIYFIIVVTIALSLIESISYLWTKNIIELRVSESTVETLKQIDKALDSLFGDVEDISLFAFSNREVRGFLKTDSSEYDTVTQAAININQIFANIANSKNYISSINIYGDNGLVFETAGPSTVANSVFSAKIKEAIPVDGSYILTPTYIRDYQSWGSQYVISFYRQINDINNFTDKLGILRIDINEMGINNIYKDVQLGDTGYIFIANKNGNIVSHSQKEELSVNIGDVPYFKDIFKNSEGYYRKIIEGRNMLVTYYRSGDQNLIFVGMVPFNELIREVKSAANLIILVTVITSVLAFFVFYIISSGITNPIKNLTDLMKRVEEGDLDVIINIKRKDEIGLLGHGFNSMIKKIKQLIEEVYKSQIKRKEAELRALQAQINPHFLYNTLDIIYWSSRLEKAPKTGEIVSALANLFKLGLNKGNEITTIEKEVEHLKSYLAIQKVRYDEEPELVIDIDSSLHKWSTIKLILQPLVENALIHGIASLGKEGSVHVTGYESNSDIIFEVIDNGIGMSKERINEIFQENVEKYSGYGVINVHERIRIHFGEDYGLTIYSNKNEGTRVEIKIPKIMDNYQRGSID